MLSTVVLEELKETVALGTMNMGMAEDEKPPGASTGRKPTRSRPYITVHSSDVQ